VLEELTRTSYQPAGAFTFFVSQNWLVRARARVRVRVREG